MATGTGHQLGELLLTIGDFRYSFSDAGAIQEVVSTGLGIGRKDTCTAAYDCDNTRSGNPARDAAVWQ